MKTKYLLIAFLFICLKHAAAQNDIEWQKCLGGTGSSEGATSIQQTTDGGFILCGYTNSNDGDVSGNHGDDDFWVAKLNSSGALQWQKCLGGTGEDDPMSIIQTWDGGYLVAGWTNSNDGDVSGNHGGLDYWVVKLNSTGTLQWQKCLGSMYTDMAFSIIQTTDSCFMVAGDARGDDGDVSGTKGNTDCWVVKLNNSGTILWQKCLGGQGDEEQANSINQTKDGGFIVSGYTDSDDGDVSGNHGNHDFWVAKLNSTGSLQWQKCLGGSSWETDQTSIEQTTDGGYIFAGFPESNDGDVSGNHGGSDIWVVKLDSAGIIQWQKCLGGTQTEYAFEVHQTTDGGFIISGYTASNNGDIINPRGFGDGWIIKLNSAGTMVWQKCLGGTDIDATYSIKQTTDGGYIVSGATWSNNGDVSGNHGNTRDMWVVKLSVSTGADEPFVNGASFSIFPNPSNGRFTVYGLSRSFGIQGTIDVYNVLGEKVYTEAFNGEQKSVNPPKDGSAVVDSKLNAGIYFVKVYDGEREYVQKIIVD